MGRYEGCTCEDCITEAIGNAVLAERERCAKIVESYEFVVRPDNAAFSLGYAQAEISANIRGRI